MIRRRHGLAEQGNSGQTVCAASSEEGSITAASANRLLGSRRLVHDTKHRRPISVADSLTRSLGDHRRRLSRIGALAGCPPCATAPTCRTAADLEGDLIARGVQFTLVRDLAFHSSTAAAANHM